MCHVNCDDMNYYLWHGKSCLGQGVENDYSVKRRSVLSLRRGFIWNRKPMDTPHACYGRSWETLPAVYTSDGKWQFDINRQCDASICKESSCGACPVQGVHPPSPTTPLQISKDKAWTLHLEIPGHSLGGLFASLLFFFSFLNVLLKLISFNEPNAGKRIFKVI